MNYPAILDVAMPGPKVSPDEKGFAWWLVGIIVAALVIAVVSIICIRKSIKKHKETEEAVEFQSEPDKTEEDEK